MNRESGPLYEGACSLGRILRTRASDESFCKFSRAPLERDPRRSSVSHLMEVFNGDEGARILSQDDLLEFCQIESFDDDEQDISIFA